MADRFITVQEPDLGAGIDQQSSENKIQPGYAEDILNMDPKATGSIATRAGFQGYLGNIPLRVKSIEYNDNSEYNLCFYLDGDINLSSIDLSTVRVTPLIAYGRTSPKNTANAGDLKNDEDKAFYYTKFRVDLKKVFNIGTDTLLVPSTEHPFNTAFLFVGTTKNTSTLDSSNEVFYPDQVSIDKTSYDISIDYTNGTGSSFEGFAYILDKSALAGTNYVSTLETVASGATTTFTYSAATHGLSNFNIIGKVFENSVSSLIEVIPDSLTITPAGQVAVTITNSTGASKDYYIVLTAAGATNVVTGSVSAGAATSITIPNLEKDFLFAVAYLEQTIGGTLEQVYPDSITIDGTAKTASISFTNNMATSANFQVVYLYANIATNKLCVTGEVISAPDSYSDDEPQVVLYGLPHSEVYGSQLIDQQGFTNHIDSYRVAAEDRLIAGLGGNLFAAKLAGEADIDDFNLAPEYFPNLRERVAVETTLGPCFYSTTDSPSRSRGYIQASSSSSGFLSVESATYQTGSGYLRLELNAPGLVVSGTLSTIISSTAGLEDYITVKNMGHSRLNGTFKIKGASVGTDVVYIDVENSKITDSNFDEVDSGGLAGIFSEQLQLLGDAPFIGGDILTSEIITDLTVSSSLADKIVFSLITEEMTVPAGLRIVGTRNSNIIQLRQLDGTITNTMVVRGDMLNVSNIERRLRVLYVNANTDETVSITGDGEIGTVTCLDTSTLSVEQTVLFLDSPNFGGAYVIQDILSETTFTILSTADLTESAVLVGNTVQFDETFNIEDTLDSSISYTVEGRWMPIEAPISSYNLPKKTYPTHFDSLGYGNQAILRSVMVQDNMYFVNGEDEVMKYDGQNIYRAGLFRWQPHLYSAIDTTATGKIDTGNFSLSYSGVSDNVFTLATAADSIKLSVGQKIKDNKTDTLYTITNIDTTAGKVVVSRVIGTTGSGATTISTVSTYSYYFRLNMVDRNNNVIGSAVAGSEDFVVTLGEDAAVNLRLVGMPVLDIYDYDRLEVQIYRTKANDTTNFFLLTTLPMSFDNNKGYIDYIDSDSDIDLIKDDILSVSLAGAELATTINEPLRAQYVTTAGNRLILGNVKDYPTMDIQFIQNQSGPIVLADFVTSGNKRYLFRKDNTDIATTTDNVNRFAYEFTSSSTSISSLTNNAGASFTVTASNSLAAGDWVYLFHSAVVDDKSLKYAGLWQVTSATGSDFTIDFPHSSTYAPGAADVDKFAIATDPSDVPVFLGTDGNYNINNGNRTSTESYEYVAVRRLANMINTSMRMVNIDLYPTFTPFMIANAGGEYGFGQLVIKQPKVFNTNLELVLPALDGQFDIFINSVKRTASEQAGTLTKEYPSRVLVSYTNYPEIMDNATAAVDSRSESAVDVNSADGQAITAIIPFFGDSAFGQASKSGIVTVFKENSIYLLDLSAKDAVSKGLVTATPVIQKLETQGKGCTAPLSVAVTRAGIMFANYSGIYRLTRSLDVEYIGRKLERIWRESVDKSNIQFITGHHYANGNQYKLSVPYINTQNGRNYYTLVYSHTREYEGIGPGSWTVYDNHKAIGWANLLDDAYFATTEGQVMSIRRVGDNTDYRDDGQAINWQFLTRAMDFGDAGIRKLVRSVITFYRTIAETNSVSLKASMNMSSEFNDTDLFTIKNQSDSTGLSDSVDKKVVTIRSSLANPLGNYLQLLYAGNTLDKPVEIAGISIRLAGRSSKGLSEAADTN